MLAFIQAQKFFLVTLLLSMGLYTLSTLWVGSVLWGDTLYYYAYTRSIAMDGDINFVNEAFHPSYGFPNTPFVVEKTGKIGNKFSFGAPVLWLPFFYVGQMVTLVLMKFGVAVSLDGYSYITQLIVGYGAVSFSVLGLYLLYHSLAKIYSKTTALYSIIILFFTTPLLYYTAVDPLNSHSASFLLSAVLLAQVVRILSNKKTAYTIWSFIFLGVTAGLQGLVRNQDILFLIPAVLATLAIKNSSLTFSRKLSLAGAAAVTAAIFMSAQLFVTISLFGQLGSPYSIGGEVFSWFSPDFLRIFFSSQNGVFFFSPVILISLLGIYAANQTTMQKALLPAAFIGFMLQAYIIAVWAPEIIGGPYGSRMFVSSLPWIGVLGAMLAEKVFSAQKSLQVFTVFFLLWAAGNMFLQTLLMLYYW